MKSTDQAKPAAKTKVDTTVKDQKLDKNRNTSSAEPLDDKELAENFAGANSSLEKPRGQES